MIHSVILQIILCLDIDLRGQEKKENIDKTYAAERGNVQPASIGGQRSDIQLVEVSIHRKGKEIQKVHQ